MAPTIRVDNEVYKWLQSRAKPFEDTPNSVLRRIAGFDAGARSKGGKAIEQRMHSEKRGDDRKTPQEAFRVPILTVIREHGGEIQRGQALKELEKKMVGQLTDYDKADISSGTVRWEKSAEWELHVMREEGLLTPASEAPRGVWALTDKGRKAAAEL